MLLLIKVSKKGDKQYPLVISEEISHLQDYIKNKSPGCKLVEPDSMINNNTIAVTTSWDYRFMKIEEVGK